MKHITTALEDALSGQPQFVPLTPREVEVMDYVAKGLNNTEIAGLLGIAPVTVSRYIGTVRTKLRERRSHRQKLVARYIAIQGSSVVTVPQCTTGDSCDPVHPSTTDPVPSPAHEELLVDVCMLEDDVALRDLVTTVLDEQRISVRMCPLGMNAHLCIRQSRPKVVILDVQAPQVNGIDVFNMMRADPTTNAIPVIFLTANPKKVRYELPDYEAMGATVVPKPFEPQQLVDLVQTRILG
jgi:DNA-binding NarL/FixJ family response regulator